MKERTIPYEEPHERMTGGFQEYISIDRMGSYTGLLFPQAEQQIPDDKKLFEWELG